MTLREIRNAYEQNYRLMVETIMEMGGEKMIAEHREKKTSLFRKLRQLQRIEHRLSALEESLETSQSIVQQTG